MKGVCTIAVRVGRVSSRSGQSVTSARVHHVRGASAPGRAWTWGRSGKATCSPWKLMLGVAQVGLVEWKTPTRSPRQVSVRTASFRKSDCSGFRPLTDTGIG